MHRLIIICFLALIGCAQRPVPAPPAFRDPDAPIYSSAVVEVSRMAGHWVQVAAFAPDDLLCGAGTVDISPGAVTWTLCLERQQSGAASMVPGKAGRFAIAGMQDWWVLWVDGDYRTMVVGTPSGRFGFVLNREASIPPDRAKAVRDIFKFNGYDVAALRFF